MASPKKKPEPQEPTSTTPSTHSPAALAQQNESPLPEPTKATVGELEQFLADTRPTEGCLLVLGPDARAYIKHHYRTKRYYGTLQERDWWLGIPVAKAEDFFFLCHAKEVSLYRDGRLVRSFLCQETQTRSPL